MNQQSNQPKKWKMAILVWLAIYPTITVLFLIFGEQLARIKPLPLQTLVTTGIVVPLLTFSFIPLLQKLLSRWLAK
jgi:antibiotic biosynthesis monooxygenase (ABM) superfamily enzyme